MSRPADSLSLSRRQVAALLGVARMEESLGCRLPVAGETVRRYRTSEAPLVSDETHLTREEMRDLHVRLQHFLFPVRLDAGEVMIDTE